MTDSAEPRHV